MLRSISSKIGSFEYDVDLNASPRTVARLFRSAGVLPAAK